jgi:twitching motility protein PilU
MSILPLLDLMVKNASVDLYLTENAPPIWREEKIVATGDAPLTAVQIEAFTREILDTAEYNKLVSYKELNHAFVDAAGNRFRFNFYYQRHSLGIVIRRIKRQIPTIESLALPDIFKHAIMMKHGLVLVVGSAGSGKSTSIAAMLDYRNENSQGHVITVEDPIEFTHEHKGCIFSQREVGIDTNSWDTALKNALRQRPDVVYIGEIRDKETMQHAINFAETGHLCIATMHATSASQAIERVANFAPNAEKSQRLFNLSNVLKIIIGQRLVPAKEGGMVLAMDILKNDGLIKPLIVAGEIYEMRELMYKHSDYGMMTFDLSLLQLFKQGKITEETAMLFADQPDNIKLEILKLSMSASSIAYPGSPLNKNEF